MFSPPDHTFAARFVSRGPVCSTSEPPADRRELVLTRSACSASPVRGGGLCGFDANRGGVFSRAFIPLTCRSSE